jgi:hypothetical protein
MTARRLRDGISFGAMAIGMQLCVFAARALTMPATGDTWWHLRTGADIWRMGALQHAERYSFTAPGWPWANPEWGWDVFSYACYRAGGMPFLTLCGAAFVIAALALVSRLMVGRPSTRFLLLAVGLPLTMPVWALRPHLFTFFALVLMLTWLVRGGTWPIPLLFVVWANIHGGVAFGGLVLGGATAVALLRWRVRGTPEDRRRALSLAVVLPLAAIACLATPLGTGMFRFLADSMAQIRAIGIGEWQPTVPGEPYGAIFWLIAIAFIAILILRRHSLRVGGHASSWGDWVIVTAALVMLPFAFAAARNVSLFLLLAVPAASRLLGPEARLPFLRRQAGEAGGGDRPLANLILLAGLGAAALVFVGWSYHTTQPSLGWRPIDERALAALRACDGPLYNQYEDGGYLIWFLPEKPVFIDNRVDPYPIAHIRAQLDVQWQRAPYRPLFDRWGIRCAFLPVGSPTVAALDRDGWQTRFRDARFAVLSAP